MTDFTTTLGSYLRHERESRGLALRTISEDTKVSLSLLEGLETDDISRWPGGIFRRAFVRSYAQCVGLDAEDVMRRFDRQFPPDGADASDTAETLGLAGQPLLAPSSQLAHRLAATPSARSRLLGTAADLTVAVVLAFACAAGGSRLLWPVLLIALYYAAGVITTGTSPMVALLTGGFAPAPPLRQPHPAKPMSIGSVDEPVTRTLARHAARRVDDSPVGQRPGMQAPV